MSEGEQNTTDESLKMALAVVIKDILQERPKILVQQRSEEGELHGKWECPGGKIEAGESPEEAASRELHEETDLKFSPSRGRWLGAYPYVYGDRKVLLYTVTFFYSDDEGEVKNGFWRPLWLEESDEGEHIIDPLFFEHMPEGNHAFLQHLSYQLEDIVALAQKDDVEWKL